MPLQAHADARLSRGVTAACGWFRSYSGPMSIEVVFETHSTTEDNEQGRATGWLPGRLSARGREQARQLGRRRAADGVSAVFTSDLARAAETAAIAFAGSPIPVLHDWRLRECDYGARNGSPASELHASRPWHVDQPYPGGESWRQAASRVSRFLADLPLRWSGQRILVIGHVPPAGAWTTPSTGRRCKPSPQSPSSGRKAGSTASHSQTQAVDSGHQKSRSADTSCPSPARPAPGRRPACH
jgi:2,3-bisphosphoglycerate-dependent phosphoglycerate mutase